MQGGLGGSLRICLTREDLPDCLACCHHLRLSHLSSASFAPFAFSASMFSPVFELSTDFADFADIFFNYWNFIAIQPPSLPNITRKSVLSEVERADFAEENFYSFVSNLIHRTKMVQSVASPPPSVIPSPARRDERSASPPLPSVCQVSNPTSLRASVSAWQSDPVAALW